MIQYEQATIEFPLPPSQPLIEQVGIDAHPVWKRVTTSSAPTDAIVHFNVYAHLVSIDPSRNRYRYYTLTWQPSIFGGGAIVRRWGRIGTEGRWRAIFFGTREEAQKTVDGIVKQRLARGYQVVQWE